MKLSELFLHRTVHIKIIVTDKNALEFCSRKLHVSVTGAVRTAGRWTPNVLKFHGKFELRKEKKGENLQWKVYGSRPL